MDTEIALSFARETIMARILISEQIQNIESLLQQAQNMKHDKEWRLNILKATHDLVIELYKQASDSSSPNSADLQLALMTVSRCIEVALEDTLNAEGKQ